MKFKSAFSFVALIISSFVSAQEFNVPESAAFDTLTNRYFISNYGDGNIIQIDSAGVKSYFQKGLSKSLGMTIHKNILYVITNLKTVMGFDISDASIVFELQINEAIFLNDITCDDSGNLYTTDSNNKAVYKININLKTYSLFMKTELDNPNGIIYDKINNRLVVCYFRKKAPIDQITLDDKALSTIISTGFDNLDGIAKDAAGNFYISSWGAGSFKSGFTKQGTIYKYDNMFEMEPTIVSTGHHGPADIYFNLKDDELAIPLFLENSVKFISIKID